MKTMAQRLDIANSEADSKDANVDKPKKERGQNDGSSKGDQISANVKKLITTLVGDQVAMLNVVNHFILTTYNNVTLTSTVNPDNDNIDIFAVVDTTEGSNDLIFIDDLKAKVDELIAKVEANPTEFNYFHPNAKLEDPKDK